MKRKYVARHNWFGEDALQFIGEKLEAVAPLSGTMSKALSSVGVTPPRELNQLAQSFQDNVIAPQAPTGANLADNVLNFFSQVMGQKASGQPVTGVNKIVANGGERVLNRLTLSEEPLFQVLLVAVIVGAIIYLIAKLV